MPKFVIEREIPNAGNLSESDLRAISQKSMGVLKAMGPEIQWLQVAMDNARFMGFCETVRSLGCNADDLLQGNWACTEQVAQQLPLDKFHCDVVSTIDLPELEDGHYIWVIECGSGTGFALKTFQVLFAGR